MKIEDFTVREYERAMISAKDHLPKQAWINAQMMLKAQYDREDAPMTTAELAEACGWPKHTAAATHYGKMAKYFAETMGYEPPLRTPGNSEPRWWMALSSAETMNDRDANFAFTMRPMLREAIKGLRWFD